jgi:hypothetical protein
MSKQLSGSNSAIKKNFPANGDQDKPINQLKQRSYSYYDIVKMESKQIYSSIGEMLDSKKITAPCYGFGTSDRKMRKKMFDGEQIAKIDLAGQIGNGPASYFPSQELVIKEDRTKLVLNRENPVEKFKYASV